MRRLVRLVGDPGAVADFAVQLDGRSPGERGGNLEYGLVDGVGDGDADRVGQPPAAPGEMGEMGEMGDEFMSSVAGIGMDQPPAPVSVLS